MQLELGCLAALGVSRFDWRREVDVIGVVVLVTVCDAEFVAAGVVGVELEKNCFNWVFFVLVFCRCWWVDVPFVSFPDAGESWSLVWCCGWFYVAEFVIRWCIRYWYVLPPYLRWWNAWHFFAFVFVFFQRFECGFLRCLNWSGLFLLCLFQLLCCSRLLTRGSRAWWCFEWDLLIGAWLVACADWWRRCWGLLGGYVLLVLACVFAALQSCGWCFVS